MHDLPKHFHPSPTLRSRNFVGLVSSQFLAAFNDQASHIVAIFYATDMLVRFVGIARTNTIVTVVTACFITPFFLFSPLAGVLADRHSKRAIIVFWKIAEVGIMALAVGRFCCRTRPLWDGSRRRCWRKLAPCSSYHSCF